MSRYLLALITLTFSVFAQGTNGTIAGQITDQAGASIANAKVLIQNEASGVNREASSNANGQYVAYALPPGQYKITVEQAGFQKLVRTAIALTAADAITVDLRLAIGDVRQTIEVSEAAPLLQSQTAMVSSLVTNDQMIEMPLKNRTFTSLVLLGPGAYAGSAGNLTSSPYAMRGDVNISVNGSSPQNNSYFIDGMVNRNLWLSTLIMVPTVDSIQEMRVLTSNYSAEYGIAAGAVTIVQTRSGTNRFRASAYEFLRNSALDANQFFNNRLGVAKPAFRRNEFGGTVGGPIRKDRTFFFADYQGIRVAQPRSSISTIATLAQREMVATGNFAALATQVFDPTTLTGTLRTPFPGNLIPRTRLDPAAGKLFALLPDPTSPAANRNFAYNPTQRQSTDQFDVRLDQNVGSADRLFFKYSWDNTSLVIPGFIPVRAGASLDQNPYLAADGTYTATDTPLRNQSATFNYVKVFTPSLINETRLGAVRWNQNIEPLGNPFSTATALGIPGVNTNDKSGGLPAFTITGFSGLGDNSTYPEVSRTTSFQYENVMTWTRGAHTLKAGGVYVRHRFNGFSAFPTRGDFSFNGQFTRQINTTTTATALSDFAIGATSGINRNILVGTFGMRFWNMGAFVDDTWRVNSRLTINAGLRYDIQAPPYEVHNRWSNFNLDTAKLEIASGSGAQRRLRNLDLNNYAPRTGLAYMLTKDRKTVLRSGFGISFVEAGQGGGQLYKNLPFFFSQVIATDQNAAPLRRLSDGIPAAVPLNPSDTVQLSSGNPTVWDYNLQSTKVMQWSFGLQREVLPHTLLDVAYIGTRTIGLVSNMNINQSVPGAGGQNPRRPFFGVNPNIVNLTYRSNYASAKYHSFQTRVEKRYSKGFTASLAYTYSKYMANGTNINGGGNGPPQDSRCTACEWGPMPEDRNHIAVFNHNWALPFGKGRQFVASGPMSYIIGNWNITGIWTMSTGEKFTATAAAGVSNSAGGGGDRPNRIKNGNLPVSERTIDRWFDLTAWAAPAQFTYGNSGRGILVGPGNVNVDFGLQREFPFGEGKRVQFRWEMFNAFNRANFTTPNSSIGNALAGVISNTAQARVMQLGLKLYF